MNKKDALEFIKVAHAGQKYGAKPYWTHPKQVADTGKKVFGSKFKTDMYIAALLHDVIEDTDYSAAALNEIGFSKKITDMVVLLTKDRSMSYAANIQRIINSRNKGAMMVKYADNYSNFHTNDAQSKFKNKDKYVKSMELIMAELEGNKLQSFKEFSEPLDIEALMEAKGLVRDAVNPVYAGDPDVMKLNALLQNKKVKLGDATEAVTSFMIGQKPFFNTVEKKFVKMVNREIGNKRNSVKFIYNQKEIKSVMSKVVGRGRPLAALSDYVRGMVVTQTQKESAKFVKDYIRKNGAKIVRIDSKDKGKDKTYGYYGSMHFIMNIDGLYVELQVMTKQLLSAKDKAHQIYDASRASSDGPTKADKQLSKRLFTGGNRTFREEVEILEKLIDSSD